MPLSSVFRHVLFATSAIIAFSEPASAQTAHHNFHIPAEDAATAFRDFARQSGRQLLFDYSLVAGKSAPGINGDLPDRIVLARLCDSTGLMVISDTGTTITLGSKSPPAPPIAASAPIAVEEVIVTATKRAEPLRNVPISISALTQRDLERVGARTVEDVVRFTPGVVFDSNGENSGSYTIRGVNTATPVGNTQSPVALYVDDINVLDPFYPKITTNLRTFDINRVEVLRGPQGTLFGSGALGGAVRVITNQPDMSRFLTATEESVASTQDGGISYAFNGVVNAPIIEDKLALRLVGYYQHDGGDVDNVTHAEKDVNHVLSEGSRAELKWTPTSDFTALASALFENDRPNDTGYSYYNSKAYQYNSYVADQFLNNSKIYNINATNDFHWAKLTSLTTYADRDESSKLDFTPRSIAIFHISNPSTVTDAGPSRTFSQEVRLASPDAQPFRWLIGGIYLDNSHTVNEDVLIPGIQNIFTAPQNFAGAPADDAAVTHSNFKTDETAIFGEASYDLTDKLTLTAGARAFRDILKLKQMTGGLLQSTALNLRETSESAITPKFAVTYKLTPRLTAYATASEGYRVGQNNVATQDPLSHQAIPAAYNPDHLWNYELGEKGQFFENRLLVNADIYYIDWKSIQLNQHTLLAGVNYIGNAGDAAVKGAEIEVKARPTTALEAGASLSLTDARLDTVQPGVAATRGDRLPGSAGFVDASYLQYTHVVSDRLSAYGRLDAEYVGREYSDLNNATALRYGNYWTVGLRAGANLDRYEIIAFVENLANSDQKASAYLVSNSPIAIRQRPRTIGLTLRAHF